MRGFRLRTIFCCKKYYCGKVDRTMYQAQQPTMKHSKRLNQGQAIRPARHMALHYGKQPAMKYSRRLGQDQACRPTRPMALHCRKQLQLNILGASGKARLIAWIGLWPCTMRKQLARKHSICLCYERWMP